MGENIGFLLPAWLLVAPLLLAIGDLMINGKLEHVTGTDSPLATRTPIAAPRPTPVTPSQPVTPVQRDSASTPHA